MITCEGSPVYCMMIPYYNVVHHQPPASARETGILVKCPTACALAFPCFAFCGYLFYELRATAYFYVSPCLIFAALSPPLSFHFLLINVELSSKMRCKNPRLPILVFSFATASTRTPLIQKFQRQNAPDVMWSLRLLLT
ncbi:hypothetical protein KCP69_04085 [Salmonella enterica subsp. enterica]|nr:hypothetical protein KCP69_04085 [Salmonella enterica subsp. enterica]